MKNLLVGFFVLGSFSTFACVEVTSAEKICPGDKVFPDTYSTHTLGAQVVAINPKSKLITVKSNYTGKIDRLDLTRISIAKGCVGDVCVEDKVYPDSYSTHTQGAEVLAINPQTKKITVKSNFTGSISRLEVAELSLAYGCISGICTGDKVFPDSYTTHTLGAQVLAINPHTKKISVKSNYTGNIGRFKVKELSVIDFCLDYGDEERSYDVFTENLKR